MGDIRVDGLGKAYKQYAGQWSRLAEWIMPVGKPRHIEHWVLKDISFHLKEGEAVGIVGSNGAGKSTLLKMLAGTVRPSCGEIAIHGRVAAMLELGMGFHPDFTGRQNAVMGGQLLGLSVEEIMQLMPEIEAFAEIGQVIAGQAPGRGSDADITLCDLTGTGVQDTAIATLAHRRALAAGAGRIFETSDPIGGTA